MLGVAKPCLRVGSLTIRVIRVVTVERKNNYPEPSTLNRVQLRLVFELLWPVKSACL